MQLLQVKFAFLSDTVSKASSRMLSTFSLTSSTKAVSQQIDLVEHFRVGKEMRALLSVQSLSQRQSRRLPLLPSCPYYPPQTCSIWLVEV